ncbi:MAG: DUF6285 domain-containing protein [Salinisphaera sp.]|nr:DUF6285 domain-containing protein [Salinisphaera sp.]
MHDQPSRIELLSAVVGFLRNDAAAELHGRTAFHAKVAANVVDIVRRELEQAQRGDDGLQQQLETLLQTQGDMATLIELLCTRIAAGEMTPKTPGLMSCLWALTMRKLEVDQPRYSGYQEVVAKSGGAGPTSG